MIPLTNETAKMKTTKTADQIASAINASGETYYGDRAKAWSGNTEERIYFGRQYVRIIDGGITNAKDGRARALTIGHPAVEIVERHAI